MATQEFLSVAFSSKTDEWYTPRLMIAELSTVFNWDLDVCSDRPNVCGNYYTKDVDGLAQDWLGLCWMNPPYGRKIGLWVNKARAASLDNSTVVCLLPARTETKWWQDNAPYASLVVFIGGRLKFSGHEWNAPFPSAFMVFGMLTEQQRDTLAYYGWSIDQN